MTLRVDIGLLICGEDETVILLSIQGFPNIFVSDYWLLLQPFIAAFFSSVWPGVFCLS
jgi:hypothetical protein